jgi:5-oxoprolinase (ATP-hydrolysing)
MDLLAQTAKNHESMEQFNNVRVYRYYSMRYDGSETSIMISADRSEDPKKEFVSAHQQQFGFTPTNRLVYVDTIRVRAIGGSVFSEAPLAPVLPLAKSLSGAVSVVTPKSWKSTYFGSIGWVNTPVYHFNALNDGCRVEGPALIIDKTQTILVSPNSSATLCQDVLALEVGASGPKSTNIAAIDPVQLSIFRHRFMGVAEQMGRVLQNVSISANIKERLDFTCAIFTPEGDLVANAPHVPAMIGSMTFAVRSQITEWQGKLQDGDVLLSNTPGQCHLSISTRHF